MDEMQTEDLLSALMMYVYLKGREFSTAKMLAVERYMRTYIRALTRGELEMALNACDASQSLDPDLAFKFNQTSMGYDRYVYRRGGL